MASTLSHTRTRPVMWAALAVLGIAAWISPAAGQGFSRPEVAGKCRPRFKSFVRTADGTVTTFSEPGTCVTWAAGINTAGTATGSIGRESAKSYAPFLRSSDGSITTIQLKLAAQAVAINNKGAITGHLINWEGFVRDAQGTVSYFSMDGLTEPSSINSKGDVAGEDYVNAQLTHGFLRRSNGKIITFDGAENVDDTLVAGINTSGQIVGTYIDSNNVYHCFIRDTNGTITTVDVPGAYDTECSAINDSGTVAGNYDDSTQGFERAPDGTFTTFNIGGYEHISTCCMNKSGYIAGSANVDSVQRGFLRTPDGTITLFDVDVTNKKNHGTQPTGLNDAGEIVGIYFR